MKINSILRKAGMLLFFVPLFSLVSYSALADSPIAERGGGGRGGMERGEHRDGRDLRNQNIHGNWGGGGWGGGYVSPSPYDPFYLPPNPDIDPGATEADRIFRENQYQPK